MGIRGDQAKQIGDLLAAGKSISEIASTVGLDIGDVQSVLAGATRTYVETLEGGLPSSGGGGTTPGGLHVVKFDFAHGTPGLAAGVAAFTPAVGDILYDAWIDVGTPWNGTTPKADIGQDGFLVTSGDTGLFSYFGAGSPVLLSIAPSDWGGIEIQGGDSSNPSSSLLIGNVHMGMPVSYQRGAPFRFTTVDPVKLWVTQDGSHGGAAAGATVGDATLYLVVATPA